MNTRTVPSQDDAQTGRSGVVHDGLDNIRVVGARETCCLALLNGMVDRGNTVVVIEHNLAVIEQADWIIDLGPEGGKNGGEIVFTGTPEKLLAAENSLTGEYLRRYQSA